MAMTSNPTSSFNPSKWAAMEKQFATYAAAWHAQQRALGHAMTSLGSAFDRNGRRVEVWFDQTGHQAMADQGSGSFCTSAFQALAAWRQSHLGHALTRLGPAASARGVMDVWMCQQDGAICYDTVS